MVQKMRLFSLGYSCAFCYIIITEKHLSYLVKMSHTISSINLFKLDIGKLVLYWLWLGKFHKNVLCPVSKSMLEVRELKIIGLIIMIGEF